MNQDEHEEAAEGNEEEGEEGQLEGQEDEQDQDQDEDDEVLDYETMDLKICGDLSKLFFTNLTFFLS